MVRVLTLPVYCGARMLVRAVPRTGGYRMTPTNGGNPHRRLGSNIVMRR